MKNNPIRFFLFLLISTISLSSYAKPFTQFYLTTVDAAPGESVCLEIRATDFRDLQAFALGIRWDTSALSLASYQGLALEIPASDFNAPANEPGLLLMTWTSVIPVTVPDSSALIQLCFTVKDRSTPHFAFVAFDDSRLVHEVITKEDWTGNPFVDARFYPGGVRIRTAADDLSLSFRLETYNPCGAEQTLIDLNVNGGLAPYTIRWENAAGISSSREDLSHVPEGFYWVTVTDHNGRQVTGTVYLDIIRNESDGPNLIGDVRIVSTDCNKQDGQIELMMRGDPAAYTYQWSNGGQSAFLTGLSSGEYAVTVTREEGCSQVGVFRVNGLGRIQYEYLPDTIDCFGNPADIGVAMEDPQLFSFSWEHGDDEPVASVQETGIYTLTIRNGADCAEEVIFNVQHPASFGMELAPGELGCGQQTDTIGLVLPPDTSGMTFFWPHSGETTPSVIVRNTGNYRVEVRQGACSETYWTYVWKSNKQLQFELLNADFTCSDTLKTIGLADPPAPGTYDYRWNTLATTPTLDVRQAGRYALTVRQGIYCSTQFYFDLSPEQKMKFERIDGELSCTSPSARIGIVPLDTVPYLYTWNTGDTTAQIEVTELGYYNVAVQKEAFCRSFVYINVPEVDQRQLFEPVQEALTCYDAAATIGVLYPDTLNVAFSWSTGDTTNLIQVTDPGNYYLRIDGGSACQETFYFEVPSPDWDLQYHCIEYPLTCQTASATIGVEVLHDGLYRYQWNTGQVQPVVEVSQAGIYELTITNINSGCETTASFEVTSGVLPQPEIEFICPEETGCSGIIVRAIATSGQAPFVYAWSSGQIDTGSIGIIHLVDRTPVSLAITDANGCMVRLENIEPSCSGDQDNELRLRLYLTCEPGPDPGAPLEPFLNGEVLSGGVPPYEFHWNNGLRDTSYFLSRFPYDSEQGDYEVTVTDAIGQTAWWFVSRTERYGCGEENNTVHFEAPHLIVPSGSQFTYPIKVYNHKDLARAIFTINWDNCLLRVDSIVQLYPERYSFPLHSVNRGTSEVGFEYPRDAVLPDTVTVMEIYFRAPAGAEGVSPFLFSINEPGTYWDGSTAFLRPHHGSITVAGQEALVLPGDSDTDRQVDHFDLLNLGLFYNDIGPDRRMKYVDRIEYAYPWRQSTPASGINIKHLDCNGDGLISALDTSVIGLNWDVRHMDDPAPDHSTNGPALWVESDTIFPGQSQSFSIMLGEETSRAEGVYGLAFTVAYDDRVVTARSVAANFAGNWLAAEGSPAPLVISRNDPERSRIHLAIVRTDRNDITGYGEVARLHFTTLSSTEESTAIFSVEKRLAAAQVMLVI